MALPEYGVTLTITVMVTAPIANENDAVDWTIENVQKAIDERPLAPGYHMVVESLADADIAWNIPGVVA